MQYPLALFDMKEARIVLAPHRRYRGIVDIGNGRFFTSIVDRDRGNVALVEADASRLLLALAQLMARGLSLGVLKPPAGVKRIGVRFDTEGDIFGCFAIDGKRTDMDPIVAVEPNLCVATANLPGKPGWYEGRTAEEAMLYATSAYIGHCGAA